MNILSHVLTLMLLLWVGITLSAPVWYWWVFGLSALFGLIGFAMDTYGNSKGDRF